LGENDGALGKSTAEDEFSDSSSEGDYDDDNS
jgi:hypothetical protein